MIAGKGMKRDDTESAMGQLLQGGVLALDFGCGTYRMY